MKRAALLLALSLAALSAQAEQWLPIASSDAYEYHGQVGSTVITDRTVSFVLRSRNRDGTGSMVISRAIVGRPDCARQSGTMLLFDLALREERMRVDFAFGAGNVGSIIAERVCNELRDPRHSDRKGVQL